MVPFWYTKCAWSMCSCHVPHAERRNNKLLMMLVMTKLGDDDDDNDNDNDGDEDDEEEEKEVDADDVDNND